MELLASAVGFGASAGSIVASGAAAARAGAALGPSPAFFIALVLYGLASLLFFSAFASAPRWLPRAALAILALAFVAHGVDIGWRGVQGMHPGMSVREALGFLSWLFVGGYLFWSLRVRLAVLGAFVAPAALAILAAARLSPSGESPEHFGSLGRIHISLATLGIAIFSLATLVALVYLFQERSLKNKRFDGVLYNNSAALETLDRLSHRLILVGFPIFTIAIVLGVIWTATQYLGAFGRPEHWIAIIAWLSFATLIVARTTKGWRGRRAAVITVLGFAAMVVVLGIYFVRRALF